MTCRAGLSYYFCLYLPNFIILSLCPCPPAAVSLQTAVIIRLLTDPLSLPELLRTGGGALKALRIVDTTIYVILTPLRFMVIKAV